MFLGLQPKNDYFDKGMTQEINNAFKNVDSAIEDYKATDLEPKYKTGPIDFTANKDVDVNNYSFYIGNEYIINLKVNSTKSVTLGDLSIAATERIYLYACTADKKQVQCFIRANSKTIEIAENPNSAFYIYGNFITGNNPLIR